MILVDQQRFYQVAVTLPAPDKMSAGEPAIFDSAAEQFLSSFKISSTSEERLGEVDQWIKDNDGREPLYGTCLIEDCGSTEEFEATPDRSVKQSALMYNKTDLPKPSYPQLARVAKASGTVKVQVIIDEEGHVIAAQAIDGHPLLYATSVAAAKRARFTPSRYKGQPAKVIGVVSYNFVAQ